MSSPVQPAPTVAPPRAATRSDDPGFVLGLVALVLAFFVSVAGLVVGIIALQQSRAVGLQNPLAISSIIVSAAMTVIYAVVFLFSIVMMIVPFVILLIATATTTSGY